MKQILSYCRCFGLAVFFLCIGCGDSNELETALVSGTVTLDGEPVGEGVVLFSPKRGRPARGILDSQGQFVLSTYGNEDGAILGKHHIAVVSQRGSEDDFLERAPERGSQPFQWLVPRHYANATTSSLQFEVKANENNLAVLELFSTPTKSAR